MVKFLAVAALLAALSVAPAHGQVRDFARAGDWAAFEGRSVTGQPVCGISVGDGTRYLGIKYFLGQEHLTVHLMKETWSVPRDARAAIRLGVDRAAPWGVIAAAVADGRGLEWRIPGGEAMDEFFGSFRNGTVLRIAFPSGSEADWVFSLRGSGAIAESFGLCILRMAPTQPSQLYGTGVSRPAVPSQPFGDAPAAMPQPSREWPASNPLRRG